MSAAFWYLFVVLVVISVVFASILSYLSFYFWKFKTLIALQHRHPTLTLSLALITIVFSSILQPIILAANVLRTIENKDILYNVYIFAFLKTFPACMISLYLSKIWLTFYYWQYNVHILELKWGSKLDLFEDRASRRKKTLAQLQNHWTLRYAYWLSNKRVLIVLSFLYWILVAIFSMLAELYSVDIVLYDILLTLLSLLLLIPIVIVYCLAVQFRDEFGIRQELKNFGIFLLIVCVLYVLISIVLHSISPLSSSLTYVKLVFHYCFLSFGSLFALFLVISNQELRDAISKERQEYADASNMHNSSRAHSNASESKNTKKDVQAQMAEQIAYGNQLKSVSTTEVREAEEEEEEEEEKHPPPTSNSGGSRNKMSLSTLLQSKQGFSKFAAHLVKEYSVESLLFLLEFAKLKYFVKHFASQIYDEHKEQELEFKNTFMSIEWAVDFDASMLEDIIAVTDVVHNDSVNQSGNNTTDIRAIHCAILKLFTDLYRTYIGPASISTINISYKTKKKMVQCLLEYELIDDKQHVTVLSAQNNPLRHNMCELVDALMRTFTKAEMELYLLLSRDSLRRFKKIHDYD